MVCLGLGRRLRGQGRGLEVVRNVVVVVVVRVMEGLEMFGWGWNLGLVRARE